MYFANFIFFDYILYQQTAAMHNIYCFQIVIIRKCVDCKFYVNKIGVDKRCRNEYNIIKLSKVYAFGGIMTDDDCGR